MPTLLSLCRLSSRQPVVPPVQKWHYNNIRVVTFFKFDINIIIRRGNLHLNVIVVRKQAPFCRRYFQVHFREWKFCILLKFHFSLSLRVQLKKISIGLDNGLASNRRQAIISLQWRLNGHDGISNHQPHDCLLNRLFGRRSKKTWKLRITGLCAGNPPIGELSAQRASNAENVSIVWRHHVNKCWPDSHTWGEMS